MDLSGGEVMPTFHSKFKLDIYIKLIFKYSFPTI